MSNQRWWDDLPEEYWELVIYHLTNSHHRHFDSVSLVCKRFLSISNHLRSRFNITEQTTLTPQLVPKLLQRFHHLKRIDLEGFRGDLNWVVGEIAGSGLELECLNVSKQERVPSRWCMKALGAKMVKSLRVLICSGMRVLYDKDLIVIVKYLTNLEELDISYPEQEIRELDRFGRYPVFVSDSGIDALSLNLPSLCRINLSGNQFISDQSLTSLSLNCVFLRDIVARDCTMLSQSGIGSAIRQNPNLVSLSLSRTNGIPYPPSAITIANSLFTARTLSVLDFSLMSISDEFLLSIGEAILPLKKLVLSCCLGYTFTGTLFLLQAYQSLNYLDLGGAHFLTDQHIDQLSHYLHHVTFINLNSCFNLTNSAFSTLAMNCIYLEEIRMERTSLGKEELKANSNSRIVSLKLGRNKQLTNETLQRIGHICPSLRLLDTSHSWSITEEGLDEIGKICSDITELEVNRCPKMLSLGRSYFFKLEVLQAQGSSINDQGLSMIGNNCTELRCLDLEGCSGVTEKGVKGLLNNCKKLRELSLKKCCNVNAGILAWMVFSTQSLRKIIPPGGFIPTHKQREMFLRHGCMVFDG